MSALALIAVSVLGALAATVVLSAPVLLGWYRSAITREGSYPLGALMQRLAISADDAAGHEYALTAAVSQCASCGAAERCRDWLASGRREGVETFCPNASMLRDLS
ncbi:MAG TPA: DUF6455 family protein [Burkholderiales bacterium]|nr:DUF6455 family protein [Burkholderiales bacterium]